MSGGVAVPPGLEVLPPVLPVLVPTLPGIRVVRLKSGFTRILSANRYGLLCIEDKSKNGLSKTLQQLTMDAQRTQLRRLSGAA